MKYEVPINMKEQSFSLLGRIDEMRRDKRFCDFLIKIGSAEIYAHRIVLAGGSDYFDRMFSHDTQERKCGAVEMQVLDVECASICIDHLYGRRLFVPDGKFLEMVHVATLMQLDYLCRAIEDFIIEKLDAEWFFVAIEIAVFFGWQNLEKKCLEFAELNFRSILQMEELGEAEKPVIEKLFEARNVTEDEKLEALLTWTRQKTDRSELLVEMIGLIELQQVCSGYRRRIIDTEQLVIANTECLRLFRASLNRPHAGIVVFDGYSGHLQRLNQTDNSWQKMHKMNDDMMSAPFSAVRVENHIYVLMSSKSVYRINFSGETSTWQKIESMIQDHGSHPPAVSLSSDIYVIATSSGHPSNIVEKYSPTSNEWTRLPDKPRSTNGSALIAFKGCIYSFGGWNGNSFSNAIELFDPSSASWKVIGVMKERKSFASAVDISGKIFIVGGCTTAWQVVSTVECYDVRTNQCTMVSSMNMTRWLHRAFAIDDCTVYAVGGEGTENSTEKYDSEKDEWKTVETHENMNLLIDRSVQILFMLVWPSNAA